MRELSLLAVRRGIAPLGICLSLAACGGEEPPSSTGTESGPGLSDGNATTGDDDGGADDDDGDGDDSGIDLGGADDGVGPPEACEDMPPAPFEIPTDPTCETEPSVGAFSPVIEWTKYEWTEIPGSVSSVTTPVVAQISDDNGDGEISPDDTPDVIFVTYQNGGVLRAVSGDGSTEILSVPVSGFSRETTIAAADIDNDGIVEILGINSSKEVIALEHDGTEKWVSAPLGNHINAYDNGPAISDMNGDGAVEIIAGRAILDANGSLIAAGEYGTGSGTGNSSLALSFAVDVDGDGQQEVVVGNALYRMNGTAIWHTDEPDGWPAVADFDLDGVPEIVVVWNANVRLQSSVDGSVLWSASIPGGRGGPPTVADYDGDGLPEIGIAGANAYTVWDSDGTQMWSNPTQDGSSGITGSAVFDFEGDGVSDVVYADETRLWVYAGHDGTVKLEHEEHSSGTRVEYPIIADVDGDGEVEIAYVNETYQASFRGLTVMGDANHSWQPGRKIWNQHAYHITNVNDDGSVPANADQNWASFNNFRSGHTGPNDGLKIPGVELFGTDPCDQGCSDGLRRVYFQIGNGGAGELSTPVDVTVFGVAEDGTETELDTLSFAPPLAAGDTTGGLFVDVDPLLNVSVRAEATASELICNVTIASVEVAIPECPEWPPPAG
ncbi:MAG: VCBS repeat-containing protein [Myxococcota bacterium]